ncbi:MAG: hypothetical protein E8D46_02065 [Nitrospira sp.]|nr:MAG: hypothetical protein E8D46_02065 [Nitrospira sp.]
MFNAIKHRVGISLLSICIMLIICQGVSPLSAFSQEALGPSFEFNPEEVLDKYYLYHDASGNNNIRHVMRKHPVLARASAGGYLFKMVKFKGITAKYGGNLTATLNLDVDTSEIRRLPQYAGMDLRVLNYEPDPEDFAYIQFYNDIGKIETLPLETTSDAAGQISFMLPLTVSQAETIFQSRSGANIPATIFMTKHVLTTNKRNVSMSLGHWPLAFSVEPRLSTS